MSDFFTGHFGDFPSGARHHRHYGKLLDAACNLAQRGGGGDRKIKAVVRTSPPRRILVVGVVVPGRATDMEAVVAKLGSTKHQVVFSLTPMRPVGKFENIDRAIVEAAEPLETFDWLIIVDDDVGLPARFLDGFIALAEQANLQIAQPAHRFRSYASWPLTLRRWGSLVRATQFVEIGPLTALHRTTFDQLVPFPPSRWCWGVDLLWSAIAQHRNWRMGVVDGTPLEHRREIAQTYDREAAIAEGQALLDLHDVTLQRAEVFTPGSVLIGW